METTITSVRENPLLDRREVELEVDHEGESTPAQEDIKERLAAEKPRSEKNRSRLSFIQVTEVTNQE